MHTFPVIPFTTLFRSYVMLFVLYITVLLYGQMIATEVATEKSSRVMEILISSASPVTHMFAKILGVGLLGLTQRSEEHTSELQSRGYIVCLLQLDKQH